MHLLRNEPLDVYVAGDLNTKSPNDTNVSLRPFEKWVEKILPSQLPLTQEAQHSFDEWSKITLMSPVSHNTCCVSKLGRIRDVTIERDMPPSIADHVLCDTGRMTTVKRNKFSKHRIIFPCVCRVSYIQYIDAGK
jgi:hypothetical protein